MSRRRLEAEVGHIGVDFDEGKDGSYRAVETRVTGTKGEWWQEGYRDRLIRGPEHLENVLHYIRRNPLEAELRAKLFDRSTTGWLLTPFGEGILRSVEAMDEDVNKKQDF
jgi:hypothetical protein